MDNERTTVAVQRYLDELADLKSDGPGEPVVRKLLTRAAARLQQLCGALLFRSYPRLTRGPLNLDTDELLAGVVERLMKAMREVRPTNVRQFFALAGRHTRWELNDLARRLDERGPLAELRDSFPAAATAPALGSGLDGECGDVDPQVQMRANARRILEAIDRLPEPEREAFTLVRVQGMSHADAANVMEVSTKTVQRRLNRCIAVLSEELSDLGAARGRAGQEAIPHHGDVAAIPAKGSANGR